MNRDKTRRRVLVIGYGNPLRGDDSLGWRAAQELTGLIQDDQVKVVACTQLTPELAQDASEVDRVLFIDAAADAPAGQLQVRPVAPLAPGRQRMTHDLDPQSLLLVAKTVYGRCPEAVVVSMGGESFACESCLSETVQARLPALLACVRRVIDSPDEISGLGMGL